MPLFMGISFQIERPQYQTLMLSGNIERRRGLAYAGEQAGYPA